MLHLEQRVQLYDLQRDEVREESFCLETHTRAHKEGPQVIIKSQKLVYFNILLI